MTIQEEIEQLGAGEFRFTLNEDSGTMDGSLVVDVVIEQLSLGGALRAEGQHPHEPSIKYRLRNDERYSPVHLQRHQGGQGDWDTVGEIEEVVKLGPP